MITFAVILCMGLAFIGFMVVRLIRDMRDDSKHKIGKRDTRRDGDRQDETNFPGNGVGNGGD